MRENLGQLPALFEPRIRRLGDLSGCWGKEAAGIQDAAAKLGFSLGASQRRGRDPLTDIERVGNPAREISERDLPDCELIPDSTQTLTPRPPINLRTAATKLPRACSSAHAFVRRQIFRAFPPSSQKL